MFERLENRRMFAVTADAFHSTLYVWGDSSSNGISVERSGADLVVKQYTGGGHAGYTEFFRASDAYVNTIRVYGYGGNDTISIADNVADTAHVYGGKGADWIKGGGGTMSHLWGHGDWPGDPSGQHDPATDDAAADILVSGKGYAVHHGQKGNDSFHTDTNAVGSRYDVMYGGDGNDKFYVSGHGQNAYAFGDGGSDAFFPSQSATQNGVFGGGAGTDTADYAGWTSAVYVRPDGVNWSGLRYGTRRQALWADVETVKGTNLADYFYGSGGANRFYARGGNDVMWGNGGNDSLYGEAGNDTVYAGSGNDYVLGGSGNDRMFGDSGNDRLYGESGIDTITGGTGSDTIVGGTGSDWLYANDGTAGNDRVYGNNLDGSGGAGYTDHAVADHDWALFFAIKDSVFGVEDVTFT